MLQPNEVHSLTLVATARRDTNHPLAGAYSTTMSGLLAVVQQAWERSLKPFGCGAPTLCEQLPAWRGWRRAGFWLHAAGVGMARPRHGCAGANVTTYRARAPGGGERAIWLNEYSEGFKLLNAISPSPPGRLPCRLPPHENQSDHD